MSDHAELPERIQRDLEEALRDGGVDKLPDRPTRRRRSFRPRLPDPRPRNPGELVLIGVVLFLIGYLLPVPFRSQLIIAGFACGLVALVTYFLHPHGHVRKYWRGRYLDVASSDWRQRLYRLIYRQD